MKILKLLFVLTAIIFYGCSSSLKKVSKEESFYNKSVSIIENIPVDEEFKDKDFLKIILNNALEKQDYIFKNSIKIENDDFEEAIKNLMLTNTKKEDIKDFTIPLTIQFLLKDKNLNNTCAFYVENKTIFKEAKRNSVNNTLHIYRQRIQNPIIHIMIWNNKTHKVIYYNRTKENNNADFSQKLKFLLKDFRK
jgi:hypothetical protein